MSLKQEVYAYLNVKNMLLLMSHLEVVNSLMTNMQLIPEVHWYQAHPGVLRIKPKLFYPDQQGSSQSAPVPPFPSVSTPSIEYSSHANL